MIPNLLNPELKDMTFVVYDPSGEMFSLTSEFQKQLGKKVYFLSLYNKADRFNILDFIDNTESAIKGYCEKLFTNAIKSIEGIEGVGGTASNWITMSAPLLASSICALKQIYKDNPSLGKATVSEAISLLELSEEDEFLEIVKQCNSAYRLYPFKKSSQRNSPIYKNCVTNITTYLSSLKSPNVEYLMEDTTIPIDKIRSEASVIYIQGHPTNPKIDAPILTPILESLFLQLSKQSSKQNTHLNPEEVKDVYVFLDEFSSLGRIDGIDGFFKNLRKDRIGIFIGIQTITQLKDILTNVQTSAILGNISHKLFLRNNAHPETSEYLSSISGVYETEVNNYTYDSNDNTTGYKKSKEKHRIISVNDAMNIDPGTGYLHVGSLGSIKIDDIKGYWETPIFNNNVNRIDIKKKYKSLSEECNIFRSKKQFSKALDTFRHNNNSFDNIAPEKELAISIKNPKIEFIYNSIDNYLKKYC